MSKTTYEFKADSTFHMNRKGNSISPIDESRSGTFVIKDNLLVLSTSYYSDTFGISEIGSDMLILITKNVAAKEGDPNAKCHLYDYFKKINQ